jgi:hypothetical protein
VIVEPADGVAERPRCGCATPAIAAATSSTPASKRIVRNLFMHVIRRRAFERHSASLGTSGPGRWPGAGVPEWLDGVPRRCRQSSLDARSLDTRGQGAVLSPGPVFPE